MVFSEQLVKDIDKYYKLKNEYIRKNNDSVAKILSNQGLTIADKRERVKEIKKRCVKCKREGGTLFQETNTKLYAICQVEPKCDFIIDINKGDPIILLPDLLTQLRFRLESEKTSLMELKINHALGTISDDDAIQMFDEKQEMFKRLTIATSSIEEKLISITNNISKNNEINSLKVDLYKVIDEYKNSLKDFKITGREEFMRDALEKYNDEILKKASELREKEYSFNNVDVIQTSSNEKEYVLRQEKYTLSDLEVPLINDLRELLNI